MLRARLHISHRRLPALITLLFAAGCATSLGPPDHASVSSPIAEAPVTAEPDTVLTLRAQRLFVRGLTMLATGEPAQAQEQFSEALTLVPDQPAILSALAEAHLALDAPSTAVYFARAAATRAPERISYLLLLAEAQRRAGRPSAAAVTYEDVLERAPAAGEARYELALTLAELGRTEEALGHLRRLVSERGDEVRYRRAMLPLLRGAGDLPALTSTLEALAVLEPADREVRRQLGEAYLQGGRRAEAVSVFEGLLAEDPEDARSSALLAGLYADSPSEPAARPAPLETGAAFPQRFQQATSLYARARSNPEVRPEAVRALEALVDEPACPPEALFMLGELYFEDAAYERAATLLREGLRANPRQIQAWGRAAEALRRAGTPAEAEALLDEGLLLFPGQPALLRVALRVETDRNRPEPAEMFAGDLLTALEDTDAPDWNAALELFQIAAAQFPDRPVFAAAVGWAQFRLGRTDEAATRLRGAVEADPDAAWIYERYGDVLWSTGEAEPAREAWRSALSKNPANAALSAKIESSLE